MTEKYILAIDQGTTSSRAIIFDKKYNAIKSAQEELTQIFPKSGWVEHDPEQIWQTTKNTCQNVLKKANIKPAQIISIGITNQRETTVVWNRLTGKPIYNAIVWQDRRTSELCKNLKQSGHEPIVTKTTGLLLDPYFSATKISWILDNVPNARAQANAGKLAFGTIDSFLLWKLSGNKIHATDATNASRTLLYDIHKGCWSDDMLKLFNIPQALLPNVYDSASDFSYSNESFFGKKIPISSLIGDQQSALIGQACVEPGMVKSTYGTGCFALINTGKTAITSNNKLLTTIAFQLNNTPYYALEGSIFIAGAAVQWLKDGLKLISSAEQAEQLAIKANPEQDIYLVPAFVGLGVPYWDADCRGAVFGLTRNTGPAEIAKATLESVCYQTHDLLTAMRQDLQNLPGLIDEKISVIRVDGGMAASNWTMQSLADILNVPINRAKTIETTALGAAYLAGMQVNFYPSIKEFSQTWKVERQFIPTITEQDRKNKLNGWKDAVNRTLSSYTS